MYCSNCGAEIDGNEARCPYCGMVNPYGAEKEHLNKLNEIRDRTKQLEDIPEKEVKTELKKNSLLLFRIFAVLAGLVIVLTLSVFLMSRNSDKKWEAQQKEELVFESQYFGELEDLYEAGDDEAVVAFIYDHLDEKGSGAFYDWPHFDYYSCYYEPYTEFKRARDTLGTFTPDGRSEKDKISVLGICLSSGFELLYVNEDRSYLEPLSGRDASRAEDMLAEVRSFFSGDLGLTDDETKTLYEACLDKDGYLSPKLCREAAEKLLKENDIL